MLDCHKVCKKCDIWLFSLIDTYQSLKLVSAIDSIKFAQEIDIHGFIIECANKGLYGLLRENHSSMASYGQLVEETLQFMRSTSN